MAEEHLPLHEALPGFITVAESIEEFKWWIDLLKVKIVGNYDDIIEALTLKAAYFDGYHISEVIADLRKQEQEHEAEKAAKEATATGS